MKRKIEIIILVIISVLIIAFLIVGFTNKTFFKTYYKVTNRAGEKVKIPLPLFSYYEKGDTKSNATFSTARSSKEIRNILSKYVEYLHTCYDESFFYDDKLDITIHRYYIENGFPFNKIHLVYSKGNYCENEFVLDDNWMTNIIEKAKISEVVIERCIMNGDTGKCDSKTINETDIKGLLNYISRESVTRVENANNIGVDETISHYAISTYYVVGDMGYTLTAFIRNNYLAFLITDRDDHSKNAIYNVGDNANQLLIDIYNKY